MNQKKQAGPQMSSWHIDSGVFPKGGIVHAYFAKSEALAAGKSAEEAEKAYHAALHAKPDRAVYFINEDLGIRKLIVNNGGYLQDFPGFEKEDFWVKEVTSTASLNSIHHLVWGATFKLLGDEILMIWPFQRDSRFTEEAFGRSDRPQYGIKLYTKLDKEGNFIHPFRIYEMDTDSGRPIHYYE